MGMKARTNARPATAAASPSAEWDSSVKHMVEQAWQHVDAPLVVRNLYKDSAKTMPDLALALARIHCGSRQEMSDHALVDGDVAMVAPYLASMLNTSAARRALRIIGMAGDKIDRPIEAMHTLAKSKATDEDFWAATDARFTLAKSVHVEDRVVMSRWLEGRKDDDANDVIRAMIALRGDETHDEWLVGRLDRAASDLRDRPEKRIKAGRTEYISRDEGSAVAWCIKAAQHRGLQDTVPALLELLHSFDAVEALQALGALGNRKALKPVTEYLASLSGLASQVAPFRLAAENALRLLGKPQSLDTAYYLLSHVHPKRYGWPAMEDVTVLQAMAGRAIIEAGTIEERQALCKWHLAYSSVLRKVAQEATASLGQPQPQYLFCDELYLDRVAKNAGTAGLAALLENDSAVFRELAAARLIRSKDEKARRHAMSWARVQLENTVNFYTNYVGVTGPLIEDLLYALARCNKSERKLLSGTSSAWIKHHVVEKSEMPYPREPAFRAEGVSTKVQRVDDSPTLDNGCPTHDGQIRAILDLPGRQVLTVCRQGKVLRWKIGDTSAHSEILATCKCITASVLHGNRLVATTNPNLIAIDLDTGKTIASQKGKGKVLARGADGKTLAWNQEADLGLVQAKTLKKTGKPVRAGSQTISAICSAWGGFLVGSEGGEVSFVKSGKREWSIGHHGMDRLERGNSHKDICDLITTKDGFISSGNDNTVRIYQWNGKGLPVRRKRIHCSYVGIFNRMALSPSGRLLAVPGSRCVDLYLVGDGKLLVSLMRDESFADQEPTVAHFLSEGDILVGTRSGQLFRVQVEGTG